MGAASSPDMFQAKMSKLIATLEFVWTYLDDQGNLDDHKIAKDPHQAAEFGLENQCTQIVLLSRGNQVPRIYSIPRWYQTTTKAGTCLN